MTKDRTGLRGSSGDAVTSSAASPTPASGELPSFAARPTAPSPSGPSDAERVTACHESGHAVAAWRLGRTLEVTSCRPGATFGGVTVATPPDPDAEPFEPWLPMIRQAPGFRADIEAGIVISLAGPEAGKMSGFLTTGYVPEDPCQDAAERAAAGLAAMAPRHRDLLVDLEADPVPLTPDLDSAERMAFALVDDAEEASLYVAWLKVVARRLLIADRAHISRVAAALLEHGALDADAFLKVVAPPRETPVIRKPTPTPPTTSEGVPIHMPIPLTIHDDRARIAKRDFYTSFVVWPGGHISPGRTHVPAGQLASTLSPLFIRAPREWRRPTKAEREAAAK